MLSNAIRLVALRRMQLEKTVYSTGYDANRRGWFDEFNESPASGDRFGKQPVVREMKIYRTGGQ